MSQGIERECQASVSSRRILPKNYKSVVEDGRSRVLGKTVSQERSTRVPPRVSSNRASQERPEKCQKKMLCKNGVTCDPAFPVRFVSLSRILYCSWIFEISVRFRGFHPVSSLCACKTSFWWLLVLFVAILNQQLCWICRFYFWEGFLMVFGNKRCRASRCSNCIVLGFCVFCSMLNIYWNHCCSPVIPRDSINHQCLLLKWID